MQTRVNLPNAPGGTGPRSLAAMPQAAPGFGPLRRLLRQRWFVALRVFALFTLLWWAFFVWNGNPLQLPSPARVVAALGSLVAIKAGLTLELMQKVMRTTMAWNQQLAVAMPKKAFQGDDSPGFACRLAGKDVRLACEVAEAQGFEALVGRAAQATLDRAGKMGMGDRDTAVLMKIRENELGIQVRQAAASPVNTA